jgi:type I pantothenate kinase
MVTRLSKKIRVQPMELQASDTVLSAHQSFSAVQWAAFKADTPLMLDKTEIERLRSLNDPIDLEEVSRIYLSISRLLYAHYEASRQLSQERQAFFGSTHEKVPFIVGIAGPVAVGKSTTARLLRELLGRWQSAPKVELVTTDGFLWPNSFLEKTGLMRRKGFPESYDTHSLLKFLSRIASGEKSVLAPVYSHVAYDVLPDEWMTVEAPDILIVEGINVLQIRDLPKDGRMIPFVSDFFDFSIYVDAEEDLIRRWYIARFLKLRETAFRDSQCYFHRYSRLSDSKAVQTAERLWSDINLKNLRENIRPTRPRADIILKKGANHLVEHVLLRRV